MMREGEITVLVVAERAVEAGEQPAAKQQREAEGEQRECQQGPVPLRRRSWRKVFHLDLSRTLRSCHRAAERAIRNHEGFWLGCGPLVSIRQGLPDAPLSRGMTLKIVSRD